MTASVGGYPSYTSCVYDAAGNVVSMTTSGASSSGPTGPSEKNTYAYDVQGRLTQKVDNVQSGSTDPTANRTTTTVYTSDGTYDTATTSNPDGSTEIEQDYIDGSVASISGTATTPQTDDEGVVASAGYDAAGNPITAGSTWTQTLTDDGSDWATSYTNMLGETYLSEESAPTTSATASGQAAVVDSQAIFDGDARPIESIDFDGSKSFDIYNPVTGMVGATWDSMDGASTFTAGVDTKTVFTSSDGWPTPVGTTVSVQSASGSQEDITQPSNGGLTATEIVNGLTTTSQANVSSSGTVNSSTGIGNGVYTVVTTNPDGTKEQDQYKDGLLIDQQQQNMAGVSIADTSYVYNTNRTLASSTDYTGTTNYTEFTDGTLKSVQPPGQQPQTVTDVNSNTEAPTSATGPDGKSTSATQNTLGQTQTQSGAGVIAAKFGYDSQGRMTSLTTYPSGDPNNSDDENAATTSWVYDPATG